MHSSLFTTLAKWAPHSGENFCTDAFAWTLRNDAVARGAFLRTCLESCGDTRTSARSTIEALSRSASIEISTQRRVVVVEERPRRWIQPDLWIEDASAGLCLLVEIKVWAAATMRRRDRAGDSDCEDQDEDVDGDVGSEYVSQATEYRRWLDRNYPSAGALIALTVFPENTLSKDCDGSIVWEQLCAVLSQPSAPDLTRQFCTYLEDVGMSTKEFELDVRGLVGAYAPPAWEALHALLTEVAKQLNSNINCDSKVAGNSYLTLYPSDEGLMLWVRWLRTSRPNGILFITLISGFDPVVTERFWSS